MGTLITHGLALLAGLVTGVLFGVHNPTSAAAIAKAAKAGAGDAKTEAKKL